MNRKKSLALLFAMFAASAAVSNAAQPRKDLTMNSERTQRNKQTVLRLYEDCINRNKPDLLTDLVAADFTGDNGETGPDGYGRIIGRIQGAVPDIQFKVEDLLAENDEVAVRWSWTGQHNGPLAGLAPTHRHLTDTGIAIFKLRNGKITRSWLESDRLGVLQQIGAVATNVAGPTKTK